MADDKEQGGKDGLTEIAKPTRGLGFGFIPTPKYLRYDPDKPFHFGLVLNIFFGFASTFTVANLYYCQPLLVVIAETFQVTYDRISRVPTLVQAGYAAGLLLITPCGDLLPRRPLILVVLILSTTLSIGLAVTTDLEVFEGLCFLVGMTSVTPQILLPLAADLAPPNRRASAVSVVFAGLLLGVLVARVISGIIAEFVTWRVVYYFSVGTQCLVFAGCYLVIPDYPSKNKDMTYWKILWTMFRFCYTEPILIQACLINLASSASFSNFWVTLTFLLSDPPYQYSTLGIGLFGLVGMGGVAMSPIVGRVVDSLVPWYGTLFACFWLTVAQAIQVGAGGINIAAVVISTLGIDIFRQMAQVSLVAKIFSIAPEARARLNAVFILSLFIGQVMGTSVGTQVFIKYGWRPGAALSLGWTGWMFAILFLRGPHVPRYGWFGYEGGLEARKKVVEEREKQKEKAGLPSSSPQPDPEKAVQSLQPQEPPEKEEKKTTESTTLRQENPRDVSERKNE